MTVSQPAGPAGPSLGDCFDPYRDDPYPFYAQARTTEPVLYAPGYDLWAVTRYSDIQEILRQPEVFSSRNALGFPYAPCAAAVQELSKGPYPLTATVTTTDGADHKRLRDPLAKAVGPERVRAAEPFIDAQANALVDAMVGHGRAELMRQFAEPLTRAVITHLIGLTDQDHPDAARIVGEGGEQIVRMSLSPLDESAQVEAARQFVALQWLAAAAIRARRAAPRADAISQIAAALAPGTQPLTPAQEQEVGNNLIEVLVAGHTTTAPLIGNGVRALLERPDQWAWLCAKPDRIVGSVEELIRFGASVQWLWRYVTRPVTVGGVTLPEGAQVVLVFASANRDERRFGARAEVVDLTRAPGRSLTFGAGTHACIGAGLARAQLRIALETLTGRLPSLRLDGPVPIRPKFHVHGPDRLPVAW